MKLMLGKPDDTEIALAEQVGGAWRRMAVDVLCVGGRRCQCWEAMP